MLWYKPLPRRNSATGWITQSWSALYEISNYPGQTEIVSSFPTVTSSTHEFQMLRNHSNFGTLLINATCRRDKFASSCLRGSPAEPNHNPALGPLAQSRRCMGALVIINPSVKAALPLRWLTRHATAYKKIENVNSMSRLDITGRHAYVSSSCRHQLPSDLDLPFPYTAYQN